MQEYSTGILIVVIIVAFVAGYSIVNFIIKRLRELQNRPKWYDETWKQQATSEKDNRQNTRNQHSQEEDTQWQSKSRSGSGTIKDEKYFQSVLGLHRQITPEEVKFRYRELVVQYHPDKVAHLGPKLKEVAEQQMKEINEAYDFFKRKYGLS